MWIWLLVSFVVLIVCFIFTYRMIVSSYAYLPKDKKFTTGIKKQPPHSFYLQEDTIHNLRSKLSSLEETSSYYEIQFSKFQQRIKTLEERYNNQPSVPEPTAGPDEEDWKEMYFEENEAKVALENELDEMAQKLQTAEKGLAEIKDAENKHAGLQSEYDLRLNDLESMQHHIGTLQRQLEGAAQREKEMEQLLLTEIQLKKQYAQLEKDHIQLKCVLNDLKEKLAEHTQKENEMNSRLAHLNELESRVAIYEEEKSKMIADLELMVSQNKMIFAKKNS